MRTTKGRLSTQIVPNAHRTDVAMTFPIGHYERLKERGHLMLEIIMRHVLSTS